ncbi:ABC transporter permease subunit [Kocuria sp. M1R5S2]|uniref:ABC transporter permease subunit n=1 Tax=Kocuria rhizosphaerae TaxID=3376285 RepID=UPI0037AC5323
MSTTTAPRPDAAAGPGAPARIRLTFAGVLRSEWIKFRSLRSNWVLLGVALLLALGFAALSASSALTFVRVSEEAAQQQIDQALGGRSAEEAGLTDEELERQRNELVAEQDARMTGGSGPELPEGTSFGEYVAMNSANGGLQLAVLLVGALAVLFIGSEYATGSIRSTMTAVPRRTPALVAKVVVLSAVGLLFGVLSATAAHLLVQPILAVEDLGYDLWQEAVLLNILAVGLFYTITTWMGFGLGALLRSTTWGVVVLVVLLFVLEIVLFVLSFDWLDDVRPWSPSSAGSELTTMYQSADAAFDHVQSGLVHAGWGLLLVLAGILATRRRPL